MDIYTLHFDGSCSPRNPGGTAAYGFTLYKCAEQISSGHEIIGSGEKMTNNVAEYVGLTKGLESFLSHFKGGYALLIVRGDSKLVINQMAQKWRAKSGLYFPYYELAQDVAKRIRKTGAKIIFEWVPRESNQICDNLSKKHLKK